MKVKYMIVGATFRVSNYDDGNSCQYWQPPKLEYMNSKTSKLITGVGSRLWKGSTECGRCLELEDKVKVIIGDYCPPPCTPMQLDLNQYSSSLLNPKEFKPKNYKVLRARKILCEWGREEEIYLDKGSSVYNWYMIPLYVKKPFKSLKVLGQEAYHDLYGRWVIGFKKVYPQLNMTYMVQVDDMKFIKLIFP